MMIDVTVENGKYRYTMTEAGTVTLFRHGEPWARSGQGDGFMMALAAELQQAREQLEWAFKAHPNLDLDIESVKRYGP